MKAMWLAAPLLAISACSSSAPPPEPRACAPPRPYWLRPHNFQGLHPPMQLVGLDRRGTIYWNGSYLPPERLAAFLLASHRLNPEPTVFLEVEAGVPCGSIEAVRDEMDRRLDCRHDGLCAEGVRSIWDGVPSPPGTPPS